MEDEIGSLDLLKKAQYHFIFGYASFEYGK
jgi:hypothetical protein